MSIDVAASITWQNVGICACKATFSRGQGLRLVQLGGKTAELATVGSSSNNVGPYSMLQQLGTSDARVYTSTRVQDNYRVNVYKTRNLSNHIDADCTLHNPVTLTFDLLTPGSIHARQPNYAIAHAMAILSVCPSVCPSVTRVDQSKTVEARITQFSPYSSPIPLVFRG